MFGFRMIVREGCGARFVLEQEKLHR